MNGRSDGASAKQAASTPFPFSEKVLLTGIATAAASLSLYGHCSFALRVLAFALFCFVTLVWISRLHYARQHEPIIWREQIVVVTGASGGLGSAFIRVFQEKEAGTLIAVDVKPPSYTAPEGGDVGASVKAVQADLGDPQQVERLADVIRKEYGNPTILINNAGIMHGKPLLELQDGDFDKILRVNTLSGYYLIREFLPSMLKANNGHIVSTASIMSYIPIANLTSYVASKHALLGLIESLHYEIKRSNVSLWLLVLGKLDTPLFAATRLTKLAELLAPTQDPEYVAKQLVDRLEALGNGRGGLHYLHLPLYARFVALLKAMPAFVLTWSKWLTAADEALHTET